MIRISRRRTAGTTLIETVMVVVVLALAAVAIQKMQGTLFKNQSSVTDFQVASRIQTECAEVVLGVAINEGYDQASVASGRFGTNKCDTLTAFSTYTIPTVTFDETYSGSGCPTTGGTFTCKVVTITQGTLTPLKVLLVNF